MRFTLALLALLVSEPCAVAQSSDPEDWARALVEPPELAGGDHDGAVGRWLAMVAREPDHPLAEAALVLTGASFDLLDSPQAAYGNLLDLSSERMHAGAARELAWLAGRARGATLRGTQLDGAGDLFPGFFKRCALLGPLGPLENPRGALEESALFDAPGFDREHLDARGHAIRWIELERAGLRPHLPRLDQALQASGGHALLALRFDVPQGGPAFVEIDMRAGGAADALDFLSAQAAPWTRYIENPSYAFALNGAAPVIVDFLPAERSRTRVEPVVLRAGRNRLMLSAPVASSAAFAIRVLDDEGRPYAGLVEANDERPLGKEGSAAAPRGGLDNSEAFLRALPDRGPYGDALLGLLCIIDGRSAEGVARVRAAMERAPDEVPLQALLARAIEGSGYLPETWRRTRSRELYESANKARPELFGPALETAKRLVPEDKEEDAIARLKQLAAESADPTSALLELEDVYPRLDMEVQAERALEAALEGAPENPSALRLRAQRLDQGAQRHKALAAATQALASEGAHADGLSALAQEQASLGLIEEAAASWNEVVARSRELGTLFDMADFLVTARRFDQADRALAEAARRAPYSAAPLSRRAELAQRRGDDAAALKLLTAALALEPSDPVLRRRLAALGTPDPAEQFLARESAGGDGVPKGYDASHWDESVVRVIDAGVVYVFPDGGATTDNRALLQVRDLEAVEKQGTQQLPGEVLEVATIKASDGKRYEPLRTNEGYVMPSLEAGDFIDTAFRVHQPEPADGIFGLSRWSFASTSEPFVHSSYVVRVPRGMQLEIVRKNFDGLRKVAERKSEDESGIVYRFDADDVARIRPEPGAPPPEWFLPSVEFGMRPDRAAIAARLSAWAVLPSRVTPEVRDAALKAIEGIQSEEERAKALHAFVAKQVDKRQPASFSSATVALLAREGNPTWLYSAMLDAAGIDHDVVCSRDVAPEADPEPDPVFYDDTRWLRRLLVVVRPKDGPEAWCDMAFKLLPYGKLLGNAPRAEAYATRARKWITMPDVPLAELVGERAHVTLAVAADRSAAAEIRIENTGNLGYLLKEQLRDQPKARRKQFMQRIAASVLPGIDLAGFDLEGLDDDVAPLVFVVQGKVKSFVDESGGELSCKLPFPVMQLGAAIAGGEGERTLPYFLPSALVRDTTVELTLPEGVTLAEPPADLEETLSGGTYRLTFVSEGQRVTIRRQLLLPPFSLKAADYGQLVQFCARADEAERARLRFKR